MMPANPSSILTINAGSSSIKFALFQSGADLKRGLHGEIDRIGMSRTHLKCKDPATQQEYNVEIDAANHQSASFYLIDWLADRVGFSTVEAIGHRVVHGMQHTKPALITPALLDELRSLMPYDPDHLPREIELVEAFHHHYPQLLQFACFDTAFHSEMPRVAKLLPIPRRYDDKGIRRYGFHGLSYAYLMDELESIGDVSATSGRVILAHLGNGASITAVLAGKSIDTSMGFTPTSGLPMSTRSGDLDPGLVSYLAQTEHMTSTQFNQMVQHESGLLGVSQTSSDMRDLLMQELNDVRAAEAISLFCYQVKKYIGAYAASLGGLDTLVFTGGIGQNSPVIRTRICEGLQFLGIAINEKQNTLNASDISIANSRVTVRVIPTDEELMIARYVYKNIEDSRTYKMSRFI
jgi:acetate kinase